LVHDRVSQELRWIEVGYGEAIKPGFMTARETPKPRTASVPDRHVEPVAAALAEEELRHAGE
jgi:hypothetical protein